MSDQQNAFAHLDRFQAIDLLMEVMSAISSERWGTAARLLGLPLEVAEDMTIDDLGNAMRVRSADLARRAGITQP